MYSIFKEYMIYSIFKEYMIQPFLVSDTRIAAKKLPSFCSWDRYTTDTCRVPCSRLQVPHRHNRGLIFNLLTTNYWKRSPWTSYKATRGVRHRNINKKSYFTNYLLFVLKIQHNVSRCRDPIEGETMHVSWFQTTSVTHFI